MKADSISSNAVARKCICRYKTHSRSECDRQLSIAYFLPISIAPACGSISARGLKSRIPSAAVRFANDGAVQSERLHDIPDDELMRRMGCGDAEALACFYDRHATLLFSIALKVLGDSHEAEEVL